MRVGDLFTTELSEEAMINHAQNAWIGRAQKFGMIHGTKRISKEALQSVMSAQVYGSKGKSSPNGQK